MEVIIMIQVQKQNNFNIGQIFGSYVLNMKYVPGREDEKYEQKEKALFEVVDDYVEQA